MRGIMQSRQKPLEVVLCSNQDLRTNSIKFHKPEPRQEVKIVSSDEIDQLINLLHNEAKVL
jgi:electron transfer flavoprotein beta subunit